MYDYTVRVEYAETDPLFGSVFTIAGFNEVDDANAFATVKAEQLRGDDFVNRLWVEGRFSFAANSNAVDVNFAAQRAAVVEE